MCMCTWENGGNGVPNLAAPTAMWSVCVHVRMYVCISYSALAMAVGFGFCNGSSMRSGNQATSYPAFKLLMYVHAHLLSEYYPTT